MQHTNQLIHETSPYLLQHAHNPVDWYPWGDEALNRAKRENKPILVSIGYAACHWCHVMERESFEDEATAAYMNEHFVNIKIDREERPDLDHIYMDAVQAMTGSGGWPLNVFLTPDAKPFYGGTYFPPRRAFNRPSWMETLEGVSTAFSERRHEIDAQAENLTEHIIQSNGFGQQITEEEQVINSGSVAAIAGNILKSADTEWGGFGKAPKFPQTLSIQYLIRDAWQRDNDAGLKQALLSLDKMIQGGIYDQVGGGFARYSTDTEWLAPHFEKMLYDNALLVSVLCEAYQFTGNSRYREVIQETMDFVQRELMDGSKAFYAALDADSEGVEGKFYVWDWKEVRDLLGDQAEIFCAYYDISPGGNFEHKNILRVKQSLTAFAAERNIDTEPLNEILASGRKKMLQERAKRVRPQLDDKIILGWNALMNAATSKAFAATGEESYRDLAVTNMQFLLENFADGGSGKFHHTWKQGKGKHPAFLDDLAFLVDALLHLQEVTGNREWLKRARTIAEFVVEHFSEPGTGFFYYTPGYQQDLILRKKELYDGAVPSGNSVMAYNLYRLGILFDIPGWKERAIRNLASIGKAVTRHPVSFANWACFLQELVAGTLEIAICGKDVSQLHKEVIGSYIPQRVMMLASEPVSGYPLLEGKQVGEKAAIYLCRDYTCQTPVFSAKELTSLINRGKNA